MSLYSTKFTGDVKRLCRDGDGLDSKCEWASSAVHSPRYSRSGGTFPLM
jgi:hypothetical protein